MAKKTPGPFSPELLDQLLAGRDPKSVLESDSLIGDLKKALADRMLSAEMDVHLCAGRESLRKNSMRFMLGPTAGLQEVQRRCAPQGARYARCAASCRNSQ